MENREKGVMKPLESSNAPGENNKILIGVMAKGMEKEKLPKTSRAPERFTVPYERPMEERIKDDSGVLNVGGYTDAGDPNQIGNARVEAGCWNY